ncbi:MAG: C25 family cysteine peptidase [Crocinitomicaceae bacterium]|nr:C25 family cysteine peptidase [Crocinitomicaceae bacterium]
MKKLIHTLSLLSLCLFVTHCYGQTYGNEWIDYGQSYYTLKVSETGIHRINFSTISSAGIPTGSFQTENIQLFGREHEIPIHIEDGGDNTLDPGDYILFYAEKNDSWLDSTLYQDPNTIGNPKYSLYNDTIRYFFTWNNSTTNLRYKVENDINFASYANIANYILFKSEKEYNSTYHEGEKTSYSSSSFFTPGEGWGNTAFNGASGYNGNLTLNTPFPYTGPGSPNAIFKGLSTTNSDAAVPAGGSFNHHLQWNIGTTNLQMLDTSVLGYGQIICNSSFPASVLSNGNTPVQWNIIGDLSVATDYQAYSYYGVTYPRQPNFGGSNSMDFEVINDIQGKIRLDIASAGYANPIMFVHGSEPLMVPFEPNGSFHSVIIPNSINGVNQQVVYRDESLIIDINTLEAVNGSGTFTNYTAIPGSYEEALLMVYHKSLEQATLQYANYREQIEGGNYNTLVANIDELYLQFGGGIEKHINGIRRFAHLIYNTSSAKPVGLFLIGKGIREANYNSVLSDGAGARKNTDRFHESLVPSFGHPSSDVSITSGLVGSLKWTPMLPTGRISARTNDELEDYLNKVMDFEANQNPLSIYDSPNKDWQKQILHFAGGSDIDEQEDFQNYMNIYKGIIEDSLYGGNVTSIFKTSSNPLDPTVLNGITDRISEGVSLMSYFGHASNTTSGFEINLDEPANWNNTGKYPLMLVNSCYNGNIFQSSTSKSEQFVQAANFGAIGYIASVGVGLDVYLNIYSRNLYKQLSYKNYNTNIGHQMMKNIESMETPSGNLYLETTCTQMVLNGDPMVKINSHPNPEIELTAPGVFFTPNNIDLTVDSIEMHITLTNLGQSVIDTFLLEVTRQFPSSSIDSIYSFQIPNLHYKDTFSFKMPTQANIGVGLNQFNISVDLPSLITEQYDEINNNQLVKTLFIDIDGIVPVVPYEFAVVPEDSVTLRASTINPIADFNSYRFEIDTTDLFNSGEHRYAYVYGTGGVKEVHPSDWISVSTNNPNQLICTDSTVYFWRVAIDSSTFDWRESSFQYITGKIGWGQDHFFQFKRNNFFSVDYDRPSRTRQFGPNIKELVCNVFASGASPTIYENAWFIDGTMQDYGICSYVPKFHVGVIDPVTLESWGTRYVPWGENLNNNFGNQNDNGACAGRPMKYFTFHQNDLTNLTDFQNMVNNEVPDGHYLLIYSPLSTAYDQINALDSANIYNTFAGLGSDSIHGGRINAPFAFFCKKGDPSTVIEVFADSPSGDVTLTAELIGNDYEGIETAPLIGPSANWGNVYWKQDPSELGSVDSTILSISAYDLSGAYQFTIDTAFTSNDSILNLNTMVDASQYPYLSLSAYYNDTVTNTPAQIDRWHVLFQPLPEAAIDGSNQYLWSQVSDTLFEGQDVDFAVDIKNIYSIDMDSLLVNYWIEDANQTNHFISYPRQDSLRVGETLRDTISFSTVGLGGVNSLWVEINPYINGSLYETDQPEQEHFNNLLQIPFFVNADDVNPILDVTFNGTHILNGDIVDPNSEILITLKDENEFLIMDDVSDTTLFGIYLTDPLGNLKRIPFVDQSGNTVMQWIPAESTNKRFKIIWPTNFEVDGEYTLFVQGADRSGNLSGDLEYKVNFEIIHESSITKMMNYPNPFSTSTRFVFTLTGSETPDDIIIQIMTVSGKVVREITESELGSLSIGRNITDFAWDGTDEFGDPLANGVYLYRVKAKINGEDIKHRNSGADTYFKKDFGKMYILR